MKIKVIKYNGEEMIYHVLSFEFRTNQVSNWIKIKLEDGKILNIHNVCVVSSVY